MEVKRDTLLTLNENLGTVQMKSVESTGFVDDRRASHVDSADVTFQFMTAEGW
jgi:hypothetical protein